MSMTIAHYLGLHIRYKNRAYTQTVCANNPHQWNTLPLNVTSASSMSVFGKRLKTHLFSHSFPESPVVPVQ